MHAVAANLLKFLQQSSQFVIPIYQRTYSWTVKECQQLWDDIIRTGLNENISAHFIGSIVYIEKGLYSISAFSPVLVIDGQQRLTTIALILEALSRIINGNEPIDGFSAKKIRNNYLLNTEEEGERGYRLLLTQTDKDSMIALLRQRPMPKEYSLRIKENFEFFTKKIIDLSPDFVPLCIGLAKLLIVDISLSRDQDNPQLIFESMNSTGRELSQADLIRNFVLMRLEPDHQIRLYEEHWRPMEVDFGQEAYDKQFDGFMRHYLTLKTGEIPNVRTVYDAFKEYAQSPGIGLGRIDELVADVHMFAKYYCAMALGQENNKELRQAFQDLRELRVDVSYPLLLELYHDYSMGVLSKVDFENILRYVESYVFRRVICGIPTNSLNKTFATFSRAINKEKYLESTKAHFLTMPSYRRFPSNEEFKKDLQTRDIYNLRTRSYFLRKLENYDRKEQVYTDEYTIEHIMPQNDNLSRDWKTALGENWQKVHETYLHTLGNLTLTGYNSEYSDRSFTEKRDMVGGFKQSPLHLNQGLGEIEVWNEEEIKERASFLAGICINVWNGPSLPDEVLLQYKVEENQSKTYTISDHEYLSASSPMRPLFEVFRKEVLALDPVVNEEFLKLYVAYKAETNFVDVIPQAGRLCLVLNIAYRDITDPKGLCRDVTDLGRWGNGDVEVGLSNEADLPYIMGLVRQALDQQLGNGD